MTDALTLVSRGDLKTAWPLVRSRIDALAASTAEPWGAEDVLRKLVGETAELWVTPGAIGFVVVSVMMADYTRDLHVWIADNQTVARAAEYLPQIRDIAADNGCDRIVFESPRRWERALPGAEVRFHYTIKV